MRVRALPETAYVFDELLTHVGSRRTEMAMGKSRHPSKVPRNVGMAITTIGEFHDLLAKTAER